MDLVDYEEQRCGGPQGDPDEETRKREERERKKAEVRKRLEDSGKKKAKKGFLTPERQLEKIAKELIAKIMEIEDSKYDLEFNVRQKDHEINELTIAVNDLRGKYVKPTLKKVSKYDNKFKKMAGSNPPGSMKVNFRDNLKTVKQDKYGLEELKSDKPEGEEEKEEAAAAEE